MSNIHFIAIAVMCSTTLYLLYMYYKKNEKRLAIIENNIQKISQSMNHIPIEQNITYEKCSTNQNNYPKNGNSQETINNNYNNVDYNYQGGYEMQNQNLNTNKTQEYVHSEQELQKEFEKYKVKDESNEDSENSEGTLETNSESEYSLENDDGENENEEDDEDENEDEEEDEEDNEDENEDEDENEEDEKENNADEDKGENYVFIDYVLETTKVIKEEKFENNVENIKDNIDYNNEEIDTNTIELSLDEYNIKGNLFENKETLNIEDKIRMDTKKNEIKELVNKELTQINLPDIDKMTVTQLRDLLTERQISYTSKLKKDQLKNLLIENI